MICTDWIERAFVESLVGLNGSNSLLIGRGFDWASVKPEVNGVDVLWYGVVLWERRLENVAASVRALKDSFGRWTWEEVFRVDP